MFDLVETGKRLFSDALESPALSNLQAGDVDFKEYLPNDYVSLGMAAFFGIAIGYTLKRYFRLFLLLMGTLLLLLFMTQEFGLIRIDLAYAQNVYDANVPQTLKNVEGFLGKISNQLPANSLGFLGGFLWGWKLG